MRAADAKKVSGIAIATEAIQIMASYANLTIPGIENSDSVILKMLQSNANIVRFAGLRCLTYLTSVRPSLVLHCQQYILECTNCTDSTFLVQVVKISHPSTYFA